jgi:hypothetical protein
MGTRNWIIVPEISKEHSTFIFKNLEAGTFTTWEMKSITFFERFKNECPVA